MTDKPMSKYKIEKNIPIPKVIRSKWGWVLGLEVGDSVLLPENEVTAVRASVHQLGRINDKRFSVRSIGNGKHRLWRIE